MQRTLSFILLFVFLFAQVGLTFGTHYCQGKAVETKLLLGDVHLGCGMEKDDHSHDCKEVPVLKDHCCENEYETFQLDKEYLASIAQSIKDGFQHFLFEIELPFLTFSTEEPSQKGFEQDQPPPLIGDPGAYITQQLQVFRL